MTDPNDCNCEQSRRLQAELDRAPCEPNPEAGADWALIETVVEGLQWSTCDSLFDEAQSKALAAAEELEKRINTARLRAPAAAREGGNG